MLLLLQVCFCFVMSEPSCYLYLTIIKLMLLKLKPFNSTLIYLDDLLNIDNHYFEQIEDQIYPTELQLYQADSFDTEAPFLDLDLSITNGIVSSKIYDKRDDFNFRNGKFPIFMEMFHAPLPMVYIFRNLFVCESMF